MYYDPLFIAAGARFRAAPDALPGRVDRVEVMLKMMFIPFRVLSGILAGTVAARLFGRIWRLIDSEQPPDPEQREAPLGKLAAALLLQGAVFGVARGLADHGSRQAFSRLTGRWPGGQRAKPEEE